jgi:hypothetical protein
VNEFGYNDVYITGYTNVPTLTGGIGDPLLTQPVDPGFLATTNISVVNLPVNVYGVPWIIGAKKGFPSFNKLSMETVVQISRKLEIVSATPGGRAFNPSATFTSTNVMWVFGISNAVGVDCWNSYATAYPSVNNFSILAADNLTMYLVTPTNGTVVQSFNVYIPTGPLPLTQSQSANFIVQPTFPPSGTVTAWPGSTWKSADALFPPPYDPSPFVIPLFTNVTFLPNSYYQFSPEAFISQSNPNIGFQNVPVATPLPQMNLATTNQLQLAMLDNGHVIDYVQFSGPNSVVNLNSAFQNTTNTTVGYGNWWSTVPYGKGVPLGIANQIYVGETTIPSTAQIYWNSANLPVTEEEIDGFAKFMGFTAIPYPQSSIVNSALAQSYLTNTLGQDPYTPSVTFYAYTSWEANDPLVHYTTNDLYFQDLGVRSGLISGINNWGNINLPPPANPPLVLPDIGQLSERFAPWGVIGNSMAGSSSLDQNPTNMAYKDPALIGPDHWDFPTNRYPTVGWIGRVHRGTPWQTVYLKVTNILAFPYENGNANAGITTWTQWTGNQNLFDATNTVPPDDRLLFDLFTTAFDDNATRGQLSINQTHLAAWSALLSGMIVPTNNPVNPAVTPYGFTVIQPAGANYTNVTASFRNPTPDTAHDYFVTNNQLGALYGSTNGSITQTRDNYVNPDGLRGAFEHKGDILSVPELTERSPFLDQINNTYNDEQMEWLPQQMMSLVRMDNNTQRYVIYCYGQALRPGGSSALVESSGFFGLCTNYQVTAESATRVVLRVEGANTKSPHIVVESVTPLPPN